MEEVKSLPSGTQVIAHGVDKHGEHTMLECTVQRVYKTKKLIYRDVDGVGRALSIKDDKMYTLKKE